MCMLGSDILQAQLTKDSKISITYANPLIYWLFELLTISEIKCTIPSQDPLVFLEIQEAVG
jgi:hypothetical protein